LVKIGNNVGRRPEESNSIVTETYAQQEYHMLPLI